MSQSNIYAGSVIMLGRHCNGIWYGKESVLRKEKNNKYKSKRFKQTHTDEEKQYGTRQETGRADGQRNP